MLTSTYNVLRGHVFERDDHFNNYLLLSCHANVFFLNFISNPIVEFVDGKQEARGSVCGNRKECTLRGRVCFAWQFLCYHFVFVFSAGGQQIGRCK